MYTAEELFFLVYTDTVLPNALPYEKCDIIPHVMTYLAEHSAKYNYNKFNKLVHRIQQEYENSEDMRLSKHDLRLTRLEYYRYKYFCHDDHLSNPYDRMIVDSLIDL